MAKENKIHISDLIYNGEILKPIAELLPRKYFVSEYGNIYSNMNGSFKILKQSTLPKGYKVIVITISRKSNNFLVHRLVAKYFIGSDDYNLVVNHKDGIKSNNHYSNLEWVTILENARHARNNGLTVGVPHSEKTKLLLSKIHKERAKIFLNPNSKKVVNIDTGETFLTAKEAAKVSGYNYSHFIEMLKGSVNNKSKFKYA